SGNWICSTASAVSGVAWSTIGSRWRFSSSSCISGAAVAAESESAAKIRGRSCFILVEWATVDSGGTRGKVTEDSYVLMPRPRGIFTARWLSAASARREDQAPKTEVDE